MADETEIIRREMVAEINANAGPRADLESKLSGLGHGELQDDFQVLGFMAPWSFVRRRSDWCAG